VGVGVFHGVLKWPSTCCVGVSVFHGVLEWPEYLLCGCWCVSWCLG